MVESCKYDHRVPNWEEYSRCRTRLPQGREGVNVLQRKWGAGLISEIRITQSGPLPLFTSLDDVLQVTKSKGEGIIKNRGNSIRS